MDTFELLRIPDPGGRPVAVMVEYLDLDHDGIPDAVRVRRLDPDPDAPTGQLRLGDDPAGAAPQVMALR